MSKTTRISIAPAARRATTERLEGRMLMAADPMIASADGTGHNPAHPDWGRVGSQFLRTAPAAYADGVATPAGAARPSARVVSNAVNAQPAGTATNARQMSALVYTWGQFIDHDLDVTNSGTPAEPFPVAVPAGDPSFDPAGTGTKTIPLTRSAYDPATGTSSASPRQQVNAITAWMDASMVYGSDAVTAASLRTMTGGRLKTSAGNLLPTDPTGGTFLAGDVRVAENPGLESIQTLFLREHNRIAARIAAQNPGMTDEQLYQQARRRLTAEVQAITFNEFLPALLGPAAPGAYRGFNPNANGNISNEFAAAAYRIGHTLVGGDVEFLDDDGNAVRDEVALADAFFDISILQQTGIDPVLKYLASDRAQEVDTYVVDDLRDFLFGPPGAGGLDLASLNVQRGRDHGLADYNAARAAYGLPRVTSFGQITSDPALAGKLRQLYGSVDDVDLWVGGLAEDHIAGGSVGPTFARIIADQFRRTRDGDRLWFQNTFVGKELTDLRNTRLADVIRRNTTLTNLQDDVFFFRASIAGQVFADTNADGRRDPGDRGVGGRTIELRNGSAVVASAQTSPDGSFRFDGLDLGTYTVHELLPAGRRVTTPRPQPVRITRGMAVDNVVFGDAPIVAPPTQAPPPLPPTGTRPLLPPPPPSAPPAPGPAPALPRRDGGGTGRPTVAAALLSPASQEFVLSSGGNSPFTLT